jgi:putative glutamine amidotransferase
MPSPIIGIVGHEHTVPRHFGDLRVTGSPTAYADQVIACGGRPALLPGRSAADLLDAVDAVVLTGGGDIDPTLYGGDPAHGREVNRTRDEHELAVIHSAHRRRLPLLGVCRGMQLLAVAFGGQIDQDLGLRHVRPGGLHPVDTRDGSLIRNLLGPRPAVTALHNQAVSEPGVAWEVTAWADDGSVEAIEPPGSDWPVIGVQWHPERPDDPTGDAVLGWLVRVAASAPSVTGTAS